VNTISPFGTADSTFLSGSIAPCVERILANEANYAIGESNRAFPQREV